MVGMEYHASCKVQVLRLWDWDAFHTKAPMAKVCLKHVEKLPTSLHSLEKSCVFLFLGGGAVQ